jgi:hypothetical protein
MQRCLPNTLAAAGRLARSSSCWFSNRALPHSDCCDRRLPLGYRQLRCPVGAELFWQQQVRSESLRRLLLAAQTSETLFVMLRPLACAADSSPASLRITLRQSEGGVSAEIIKRKDPISNAAFVVPIEPSSILIRSQRTHRKLGEDQSQVENAIVVGA